jgi:GDP-L-fucose synthase
VYRRKRRGARFVRVVLTGARGFLGRHLVPVLRRSYEAVAEVSRSDYDLTRQDQVERFFRETRPDVLVHLAAYVGGIGANRDYPADFFIRNTLLTSLVFDAAARHGVRKMIYPMGGCSYPAKARSPIGESQMWEGYPQPESAPYSIAKKTALVASASYRKQYGLNSVVIVPGNMYGEYDNFDLNNSHVVPAMIRRFFEAKLAGAPSVALWGSGAPERDFVYAGDIAETVPYFIDQYDSSEPVNLSSGTATTIRELAETVRELLGYPGEIVWDRTKPDGQMIKIFDVSRMRALGLTCPTTLQAGLRKTIDWFQKNYYEGSGSIRQTETVTV